MFHRSLTVAARQASGFFMRKPDAAAVLAGKMIETLERLRDQGGDAYPATLSHLAAQADPAAPADLAAKALKKKPFAARLLAARNHPDSPVALAEDAGRLADAPRLIEFILSLLCTPEKRLHAPAKLVAKVDKALKPAFAAALQRRLAAGALPAAVGVTEVRGKPQLYLRALAPPALALAQELISALRECKKRGDAYPPRLSELTNAPPDRLRAAVAESIFKTATIRALANDSDGLIALAEDARLLADSPRTLEAAVTAVRTPDHQAVPLSDLKRKIVKPLQAAFEAAVIAHVAAGAPLPPAVGRLYVRKKPHFFLWQDVSAASRERKRPEDGFRDRAAPPVACAPGSPIVADFAVAFDAAFERLNRQRGGHNLVSLVELRPAVPVDRAAFDAGLQQLRRAGRYTLSNAEGRHGVSQEERTAGLVEDSALLLFVSRKATL